MPKAQKRGRLSVLKARHFISSRHRLGRFVMGDYIKNVEARRNGAPQHLFGDVLSLRGPHTALRLCGVNRVAYLRYD